MIRSKKLFSLSKVDSYLGSGVANPCEFINKQKDHWKSNGIWRTGNLHLLTPYYYSKSPLRSYSDQIRPPDSVGFGRIWLNLVGFGRIWSDSVGFSRIWSDLVGFGRIWLDLVGFGRIWSDLVGFGRIWLDQLDLVRFGRIWSDSVGFCRIWSDSVGVAPGRGPILELSN